MKKLNKKGFTIVELVIVIAVIAILASVLIPTFTGIVRKAQESAAIQVGATLYKEALALDLADGVQDGKEGDGENAAITEIDGKEVTYTVTGETVTFEYTHTNGYKVTRGTDGKFTAKKTAA